MADISIGRHVHFITKVDGLNDIRRMLAHAERRAIDLSPVLRNEVNEITQNYLEQVFKTDGGAAGAKWAPLEFSTRKWKSKHGFTHGKILRRTFEGMYSLIDENENSIIKVRKRTYERGTNLQYMNLQNTGYTLRRWGKQKINDIRVPARPWMPSRMPQRVVNEYMEAISNYIVSAGGRGFSLRTSDGVRSFDGT